ncbi:hypothetical protein [Niallia sp. Krafla_26]
MEKNWSIALEHDEYEEDRGLVVRDAIQAVKDTGGWLLCKRSDTIEFWKS